MYVLADGNFETEQKFQVSKIPPRDAHRTHVDGRRVDPGDLRMTLDVER